MNIGEETEVWEVVPETIEVPETQPVEEPDKVPA
jgi:hypothetical protein